MSFAGMNDPRSREMLAQILRHQSGAAVADAEINPVAVEVRPRQALLERLRAESGAAVSPDEIDALTARASRPISGREAIAQQLRAETGAAVGPDEVERSYQALADRFARAAFQESGAAVAYEEIEEYIRRQMAQRRGALTR